MGINELTYESVGDLFEGITKYAHNKEEISNLSFKILNELKKIKTDYDISNFINKLAMSN